MTSMIHFSGIFSRKLVASFCVMILIAGCQIFPTSTDEKIVGGSRDIPADHPGSTSTVALVYENAPPANLRAECTGTVIAKNLILTAAHCVDPARIDVLKVYFTKNSEFGEGVVLRRIKVADYRIFPKFFEPYDLSFDVAWLKLAEPIPDFALPMPIVVDDKLLVSRTPVDLAGYGNISFGFSAMQFEKRFVTVRIEKFLNRTPFHALLFFREPGKGMCYGDSGGPLFMKVNGRWTVAGVTKGLVTQQFGGNSDCKDTGIYTFPGMYIDWLERTSGTKLTYIGNRKAEQVSDIWVRDSLVPIDQICGRKELSKNEFLKLSDIHFQTNIVDCSEAIKAWNAKR